MDINSVKNELKNKKEMNPDSHDGSYELMREVIRSYSKLQDFSLVTYLDLDAVYLCAIGKINVEKKKEKINNTCLPVDEKARLIEVLDIIWDKACLGKYDNVFYDNPKKPAIGMFGTGFMSFKGKTDDQYARDFIKMCTDILVVENDDSERIFSIAEQVVNENAKGMKAASASIILHCLRPCVFPIINKNEGKGTIFSRLGIKLNKELEIGTYIDNCRKITKYRDANYSFKNYRIMDLMARELSDDSDDLFKPSKEEYDPGITADQYVTLLKDGNVVKKDLLDVLYYMYLLDGEASCKKIENSFGNTAAHYNANATAIAKAIQKETGCKILLRDNGQNNYWPILFQGRDAQGDEEGGFIWKMRPELFDAVDELDSEAFFEEFKMKEKRLFDHNMILYGPPGTGKTYNTVNYAVAIIENKSLEEVESESYDLVKARYAEYMLQNRIKFTTFHQSYGYEEFIEGIRPVMENEQDENEDISSDNSDLKYELRPGVFKKFCDDAKALSATEDVKSLYEINIDRDAAIWKISLEGAGSNPTRTDCMLNNYIRIGWDEYGEDIDKIDESASGATILKAFANKLKVGDLVLSCYSKRTIDAIGIVTGEYEYLGTKDYYNRARKVEWLVKDIQEDIVDINGGKVLTLSTLYQLKNMQINDVIDIINKYRRTDAPEKKSNDNYVMIIDEINRGNISKIFGELITLIETTKRAGEPEEMSVVLPYSQKPFSVPNNVYILGTMNTADRSIALMDTALRRRFTFVEMMPNTKVLENLGITTIIENDKKLDIISMIESINSRIKYLFDREHTIGHAFFTGLKKNMTINELKNIFVNKIIPLLQEYFYDDYQKIQWILGDNNKEEQYKFILDEKVDSKLFMGKNGPEIDSDEKLYSIQYSAFDKIESYIHIYE